MAGMGSGLTGGGVLTMETRWVAGWKVEATRGVIEEATGGLEVSWTLFYRGGGAWRPLVEIWI